VKKPNAKPKAVNYYCQRICAELEIAGKPVKVNSALPTHSSITLHLTHWSQVIDSSDCMVTQQSDWWCLSTVQETDFEVLWPLYRMEDGKIYDCDGELIQTSETNPESDSNIDNERYRRGIVHGVRSLSRIDNW